MKKSPSLALRIGTSLGFCLIFAPCFWRFGLGSLATLFLPLSVAGLWGKFYERRKRLSRIEQDWEIFHTAFFILACGLAIVACSQFSIVGYGNSLPKTWVIPALSLASVASAITFRFHPDLRRGGPNDLKRDGPNSKTFIYICWPILLLLLAFGDLAYLNGALDFQAPRAYSLSILGKRYERGSKSARGPLIEVPLWHDKTRNVEVKVPYADWCRARIGNTARVSIKPGFLGAEWVEAARVN